VRVVSTCVAVAPRGSHCACCVNLCCRRLHNKYIPINTQYFAPKYLVSNYCNLLRSLQTNTTTHFPHTNSRKYLLSWDACRLPVSAFGIAVRLRRLPISMPTAPSFGSAFNFVFSFVFSFFLNFVSNFNSTRSTPYA
jgi:hypothetical protein